MNTVRALASLACALALGPMAVAQPVDSEPSISPLSSNLVGWLHWAGLSQLRADPRAAFIMRLWDLPESCVVETQTLDKLAATPWRLVPPLDGTTYVPTELFRPLLDDLLHNECALKIRHVPGRFGEIGFAIRLDAQRAGVWETNFIGIMQYLTHLRAVPSTNQPGWTLKKHHPPNLIELTRVGDWTLMGLAQEDNPLLHEMAARAAQGAAPLPARDGNDWFEAECEPRRAVTAIRPLWHVRSWWPRISFTLSGDGTNALEHGEMTFSKTLPLRMDPWSIPTSLLATNLTSFTAIRGFAPSVERRFWWTDFLVHPPPDQLFFWTVSGSPLQTYAAAPEPNASAAMKELSELFRSHGNRWLARRLMGRFRFQPAPDGNGVVLSGLPLMSPFLKSVESGHGDAILAGLIAPPLPAPAAGDLARDMATQANMLCYGWENSARQMDAGLSLAQLALTFSRRAPMRLDSPSGAWLRALAPQLGAATTMITLTASNRVSFERTATVGLTAVELSFLANWLESPEFPFVHRDLY